MSEEDTSDDDWFESALEDNGDGETDLDGGDRSGAAGAEPTAGDAGSEDREGDESTVDEADTADASSGADHAGSPFEESGDTESPFEESGDTESPFEESGDTESPFEESSETGSPFEESGDTDSPFDQSSETGSPFESGDADTPGGSAGSDRQPEMDADSEGGLFDDDFASAFESAGGGETESDFEEDFDSDIPRVDIGIDGLDQMIQGGIPERHLMVTIGSAGTGKTTFGLQFLHHGLKNGENAVFLTLEQSHEAILDTASDRDWGFEEYETNDQLAIVDLDPVEMANSLDNIRGELPTLIEDFGADRLVLDSVSLLEMMYDDQSRRRTEVFDFTRSLKQAGVTTMLVSEANEDNPFASRHGIIEYLTDAVFILQYVRSETRETRLAVEIQKIRNANHSRETKPYEITMDGISVYQQANIF